MIKDLEKGSWLKRLPETRSNALSKVKSANNRQFDGQGLHLTRHDPTTSQMILGGGQVTSSPKPKKCFFPDPTSITAILQFPFMVLKLIIVEVKTQNLACLAYAREHFGSHLASFLPSVLCQYRHLRRFAGCFSLKDETDPKSPQQLRMSTFDSSGC